MWRELFRQAFGNESSPSVPEFENESTPSVPELPAGTIIAASRTAPAMTLSITQVGGIRGAVSTFVDFVGTGLDPLDERNRTAVRFTVGAPRFELGTSSPPD